MRIHYNYRDLDRELFVSVNYLDLPGYAEKTLEDINAVKVLLNSLINRIKSIDLDETRSMEAR